ncbi:unnamed protein product [Ectocarpus sp. CCAP 1310/34]|nr:unnamed protein product [Ectocarpus sp. CCAP 1310/34]
MVERVLGSDAATAEACGDAPRHGSKREKLVIPEDGKSNLADRLTMLKLGKQGSKGGAGVASRERPDWGALDEERKQEGPSLMEQMMAEAMAAKEVKSQEQRLEQSRDAKQTFGGGLKKGFLSRPAPTTAVSSAAPNKLNGGRRRQRGKDSTSGAPPPAEVKRSIPVITGRKASSGGLEFDVSAEASSTTSDSLLLPEVQEAMKHSASNPLGGASGGGGGQEWLTPELLQKISEKPLLAAMLTDPRFSKAMQLMPTSPKDALGMFESSTEARESFIELMSLLSKHFTAMGEAADEKAAAEEADRKRVADGPLAQEALRRAAEGVGVAATPATAEETATVERVLQQPELRELLMDPGMQRVLQECGNPQELARYIRHPEFGPKLQLMAKAGLISFRP